MALRFSCAVALTAAVSAESFMDADIRDRRCLDPDVDLSELLSGTQIRVALYSGELSKCVDTNQAGAWLNHCTNAPIGAGYEWPEISQVDNAALQIWKGYDVTLLDELAEVGNFTYTIINVGRASDISSGEGYTGMARKVLGLDPGGPVAPADLFGQSTWRINQGRLDWAVWSVPMVTEAVELLALKETLAERTFGSRVQIMFDPFDDSVWIVLAILLVFYTSTMMLMAHRHKETVDELSRADVAYDACLTMFGGGGAMDHQQHHTKSISIGWIIFSVLIFEIYFAKLTAILSEPPQIVATISGIKELQRDGNTFCVQRNAANDPYFTYHPRFGNADPSDPETAELHIVRKDSVPHQIDGVLDGSCTASEITREDFYLWAKNDGNQDNYCLIAFVGQPITTRNRGMMTARNSSCVLTAINTVYHALGVRLCPLQRSNELCDAQSILDFEFPEPNCDGWSNPNLVSVKPGLGLEDLFGPFMILATLWIFGILFGRLASEHPEWRGLSWWTLSPVARDIKAATMIHRERQAAVWEENLVAGRKMKAGALAVMFANHHQPDGFTIHGKPVSAGAPEDNVIVEDWGPGNPNTNPNTSSVKVKPSDSREGRLDI